MEAVVFRQNGISTLPSAHKNLIKCKPKHLPSVVCVLKRSSSDGHHDITVHKEEPTKTNVYNDTWFDLLAINFVSKNLQAVTGLSNNKSGYESLVEATTMVKQKFSPIQQQQLTIQALHRAFPQLLLSLIKTMMRPCTFTRELFAVFTTWFFTWLVGSSEVRESDVNGRREKNVVYIKKCRFLEESNCVGMCINLCKMPSQSFLKDSMGVPVNMVPNFDDMSCEIIFGQDPPASSEDPALKQPCYKLCKAYKSHGTNFPS